MQPVIRCFWKEQKYHAKMESEDLSKTGMSLSMKYQLFSADLVCRSILTDDSQL